MSRTEWIFRRSLHLGSSLPVIAYLLVALLGGCTPKPKNQADHRALDPYARQSKEVLGSPAWVVGGADKTGSFEGGHPGPGAWSILLATVPRDSGQATADQTLAQVQRAGIPDARLEQRDDGWVVLTGSYADPADPVARADLQRIQALQVRGATPFVTSILIPPPVQRVAGASSEFDLSLVRRKRNIPRAVLYSLQVGVYERSDGQDPSESDLRDIRAAAERGAAALRADGEEAYFYHGPRRSMVTVGIFTEDDYSMRTREGDNAIPVFVESPKLRALRQKYPYNLVNGQALRVRTPGQEKGVIQPSMVVEIPR